MNFSQGPLNSGTGNPADFARADKLRAPSACSICAKPRVNAGIECWPTGGQILRNYVYIH